MIKLEGLEEALRLAAESHGSAAVVIGDGKQPTVVKLSELKLSDYDSPDGPTLVIGGKETARRIGDLSVRPTKVRPAHYPRVRPAPPPIPRFKEAEPGRAQRRKNGETNKKKRRFKRRKRSR